MDNVAAGPARTATVTPMRTYHPWEVRDPAAMLDVVLTVRRPGPGDVFVVLLRRADTSEQTVLDVVRVHQGHPPEPHEASEMLRDRASRLVGPRPWTGDHWASPQHVLTTVVCRPGRVVPGPVELFWLLAWRYSNHHADAFDGDVYLVTDHGWTGTHDQRAGFTPALRAAGRNLTLTPERPA